jgi:DNA-binding transcriptional ArsR family regulator
MQFVVNFRGTLESPVKFDYSIRMEIEAAIAALAALAQETRLEIFRLLVQHGPEGLPAGIIGERLKQPSPTLSFHLNQLRFAGLITSRRKSRSIIYAANFAAMMELMAYLTENCCGGQSGICFPESEAAGCEPPCKAVSNRKSIER